MENRHQLPYVPMTGMGLRVPRICNKIEMEESSMELG
jgi:hypothetical protein